ncbi:MAG: S8 family serine peptidase [Clostridia bacterium]|nr:S8 family serine peptidase [Clostridia bacterium]
MKKSFKGFLACLLALMLVLPAFSGAMAQIESELKHTDDFEFRSGTGAPAVVESEIKSFDASTIRNGRTFAAADVETKEAVQPNDIVMIMVELEDAPAVEATANFRNATAYREMLLTSQKKAANAITVNCGVDVNVLYNYTVIFNGFAFEGEYRLVEEINKLDGMRAFVAGEWEAPNLVTSVDQVSAPAAWDLGYSGQGYAVAIIDTGCKVDHPAFSVQPDEATVMFTSDDIQAFIDGGELQGNGADEMTLENVYYSAKIPFRWNYFTNVSSVAHGSSDHGTHVAGITAGNNDVIRGVAPDAQIVAMQVFNPKTGTASWAVIIRAMEDCAILGVAAANLSLGSACGSEELYDPSYAEVLERCADAGVNIAMSAGNDYDAAMANRWGGNFGITQNGSLTLNGYTLVNNIDFGVVGSPSTWPYGVSVAAVQNAKAQNYFVEIDGVKYMYTENAANPVFLRDALGGQTVEFVFIEGPGNPGDFEGVDVDGKVAFVQRGSINFVDKAANAEAAGAVACVVYNNTTGTINMVTYEDGGIPHVAMTLADAQAIQESGATEMFIGKEMGIFEVDNGNMTTGFSSRGFTANMAMKPEITAPGGAIYSSTDSSVSGVDYEAWNGTSMSSPHIAGGMAIISEYVDNNFPDASDYEKQCIVTQILMSTTTPIYSESGEYAPVHQQGAGEMNLAKATTTTAYITVEGTQGNRPKLNLGDDPEKTGADYEATFTVHNFGEEELKYNIAPSVLLLKFANLQELNGETVRVYYGGTMNLAASEEDEALIGDVNGDGEINVVDAILISRIALGIISVDNVAAYDIDGDGEITVADAILATRIALELEECQYRQVDFGYINFEMPGVVTVPAGGETEVNIKFSLDDEELIPYLDYYYTAGAMLEGFFELMPLEGDLSLTVPFIKFYGDWNESATLDYGYYYEDAPWNSSNFPNTVGCKSGKSIFGLGINPYVMTEDMSYYLEDRNAISPNGDGFMDTVDTLYAGLLRNSYITYTIEDPNGTVLQTITESGIALDGSADTLCNKDYLNRSGNRYQFGLSYCAFPTNINFTQFGEDVVIHLIADLENDGMYTTNAFTRDVNQNPEWKIPVHVDTVMPTVEIVELGDQLTVQVGDDHYVAAVIVIESNGTTEKSAEGLFETERGVSTELTIDIVEGEYLLVADYAGNEAMFMFDGEELIPVEAPEQEEPYYSMSFEADESLDEWYVIDADGDGNNFGISSVQEYAYDGKSYASSKSWSSATGALTPDNWLITAPITLPEGNPTFSFWASGFEPNYCYEHIAVYIIEAANFDLTTNGFIEILPETVMTEEWQQFMIDLTEYAGKDVRIAVRHFNCTDENTLKVDLLQIWE